MTEQLRIYYDAEAGEAGEIGTPWMDRPCIDGKISDEPLHEPLDVMESNDEYEVRKCIRCGMMVRYFDDGLEFMGYQYQNLTTYFRTLEDVQEKIKQDSELGE